LCVCFLIELLLLRPQLPRLLGLPPPLWLRLADCAALGGASQSLLLLLLHPGVNTGVLRRLRQASWTHSRKCGVHYYRQGGEPKRVSVGFSSSPSRRLHAACGHEAHDGQEQTRAP
jgi:hypothetical protein